LPDDVRKLFSTQLNENKRQFSLGTINFETWSTARNKIGQALLEADPNLTLSPGHQPIDKNKINAWLDAGQADLALEYLQNAGSKIAFLLEGRLTRVNQAYKRGIIPEEEANREKSRIKYAIITLAE
jgi:ribosomal protein S20